MCGGVQHFRRTGGLLPGAAFLVAALLSIISAPAFAGAWTRPAGDGLLITSFGHHRFDLGAEGFGYSKFETALYAEYGLTDRFTLTGRLSQETRQRRFQVEQRQGGAPTLRSLSSVSQALGESEIGLRANLLTSGDWVVSAQTSLVRFSADPNPLLGGKAVWGADARLQIGRSVGEAVFMEAQLGRRSGWDGARAETRLDLTLGVRPAEGWRVLAQGYSAWGQNGWGGYHSRFESHRLHLSVIAPLCERLSLQIGVINSVHSDRLAPEQAYMLSFWREF